MNGRNIKVVEEVLKGQMQEPLPTGGTIEEYLRHMIPKKPSYQDYSEIY